MANTLKFGNGQWATGNGTALAYNDENANFKPLPFDFTRASSGTVVNQSGLIETVGSGIPRIDFQGNTKGALLLEPSRTNLITYSEDFSNAAWDKINSSVQNNSETSPEGIANSYEATILADGFLRFGPTTTTAAVNYTFTCYIKKAPIGGATHIRLTTNNTSAWGTGISSKIELTNSWQRVKLSGIYISSGANSYTMIGTKDENNNSDSDCIGNILVYGAQLELGSYATSYIPTSGSAVTRVAETNRQTPPSGVIGQTEGTMFVDCKVNAQGTYTGFSLNDNTTNNEVIIRFTTQDRIEYYLRSGGSQPIGGGTTLFDTDKRVKIAFAYKSGDSSVYINGAQVTTSTTTTMPVNLSIIKFARGNSTADFSGKTNDFKVYNTRLSNAELAALTQV